MVRKIVFAAIMVMLAGAASAKDSPSKADIEKKMEELNSSFAREEARILGYQEIIDVCQEKILAHRGVESTLKSDYMSLQKQLADIEAAEKGKAEKAKPDKGKK